MKEELAGIKSLMSREFDQISQMREQMRSQQSNYISKVMIKPEFISQIPL